MEALLTQRLTRIRARLPARTTCFRWVDDGGLPGVTVDVFGDVGVLSFYRPEPPGEGRAIAEALVAIGGLRSVFVKHRPREAKRAANEAPDAHAPPRPILGPEVPQLEVEELGVRFLIRPGNGLSVGLYLDARDARAWVQAQARGLRVLNLFSYTCGFGVVARVAGAARAVNVDASRKVLEWGEANLALNGVTPDRYDFISGDAFDWLGRFAKKEERFDLVILDPPGFATTKSSRFTASRDYHRLVSAASKVVASGGRLLSMCNVEALSPADFQRQVEQGLGARRAKQTNAFGASEVDFEQPPALKCLVHELR